MALCDPTNWPLYPDLADLAAGKGYFGMAAELVRRPMTSAMLKYASPDRSIMPSTSVCRIPANAASTTANSAEVTSKAQVRGRAAR
jgi:hypothetical protein